MHIFSVFFFINNKIWMNQWFIYFTFSFPWSYEDNVITHRNYTSFLLKICSPPMLYDDTCRLREKWKDICDVCYSSVEFVYWNSLFFWLIYLTNMFTEDFSSTFNNSKSEARRRSRQKALWKTTGISARHHRKREVIHWFSRFYVLVDKKSIRTCTVFTFSGFIHSLIAFCTFNLSVSLCGTFIRGMLLG